MRVTRKQKNQIRKPIYTINMLWKQVLILYIYRDHSVCLFSGKPPYLEILESRTLVLSDHKFLLGMGSKSDQNSLCEKSMKVVTNMIRMSSFSLSYKTLGTCRSAAKDTSWSDKVPEMEPVVVPSQSHGSRRSLKPQSRSNPTYVIKPAGNNEVHSIHEERIPDPPKKEDSSVDRSAAEYIEKIRKQLGCR